jgi:hypothetical protein
MSDAWYLPSAANGRSTEDAKQLPAVKDESQGEVHAEIREISMSQGGARIDSMFDQLEIGEDEFDDFDLAEDEVQITEGTQRLVVVALLCPKKFSHEVFFQ